MVVTPELRAQILRLYLADQWRIGTIARQLQLHRDTVGRVLAVSACIGRYAAALDCPLHVLHSGDAGQVSNAGRQLSVRDGSRARLWWRPFAFPLPGRATASPACSRGLLATAHPGQKACS